jgi:hypothetical protein
MEGKKRDIDKLFWYLHLHTDPNMDYVNKKLEAAALYPQ